jgi:hypothetical protein
MATSKYDAAVADERDWRSAAVLAVGLLLCGVVLLYVGRHLSFFADEWSFALDRRGWNVDSLLADHNGHLVLVPAFIYKVLFEVVGFAHSWPYRFTLFLFHAASVVCIYLLARRRFGPWLALFPAGLLLLPGSSNDDLLGAFQIAFVGAMAFGLAALLYLDREERRFDIAATVLIALSISCSTLGLAFALGILAELALTREKRPRLYVALVPFALYALWFFGFHSSGGENTLLASNIRAVPRYDARVAAQGFAGFGSLPILFGTLLMVGTAGWLAIKFLKERGLPARAFVGIVGALAFWTLAALARAQINDAAATRYIYPSMVFILVIVIACLPPIRRVSWQVGAVLAAIVCFAFVNGLAPLHTFIDYRAREDALVRAEISAETLAVREGDPWLAAVRDLDYPALTARQIMALPLDQQLRADRNLTLTDAVAYGGAAPEELEKAVPAPVRGDASLSKGTTSVGPTTCTLLKPKAPGAAAVVKLPPTRDLLLLRPDSRDPRVAVRIRRLASDFQHQPVELPADALPAPGDAGVVRIVDDKLPLPWYARVEFSGPVGVCLVAPLA